MSDVVVKDLSGLEVIAMSGSGERLDQLKTGIQSAGVMRVLLLPDVEGLRLELADKVPGLVVIDIPEAQSGTLKDVLRAVNAIEVPIILFLDSQYGIDLAEIMDAGVSTAVVDGFASKRLPHLMETTLLRHSRLRGLEVELAEARSALEDRKILDRAKAILIQERNLSEPDAYALLRKAAMSRNCKISEIAHSIVVAHSV